jgi:hypothetical protein
MYLLYADRRKNTRVGEEVLPLFQLRAERGLGPKRTTAKKIEPLTKLVYSR